MFDMIYTKKMVPNAMKRTNAMCKHVFTAIYCLKSKFQTIHCSKQMWDLLTAVNISKGNHQTIGKLDVDWVWAGFGGKIVNFEVFTCWMYTKEVGAQCDENDKCYVQTCFYCVKSKFQTIHCSKQMWDLLTAVYISKGNYHRKIRHFLCIPWV